MLFFNIHSRRNLRLLATLGVLSISPVAMCAIIRVDPDSPVNGLGNTWPTAFHDLQDAMAFAVQGDDIWVADSVYKPTFRVDPADPQSATFSMKPDVKLLGGFQGVSRVGGGEISLPQRNPELYETILDGDIGVIGDHLDNVYSVVNAAGVIDDDARLNGFTVRHANNGIVFGGEAAPVIIRCKFTSNSSAGGSGTGALLIGRPEGMPPVLVQFLACTFAKNNAAYHGAGVYCASNTKCLLVNCLGYLNTCGGTGSFLLGAGQSATIINCTVTDNAAGPDSPVGGAFRFIGGGTNVISNCVVYGNTNGEGSNESAQISTDAPPVTVRNSNIQHLSFFAGNNNINVDPLFVDAVNHDYRLKYASKVLNNGLASDMPVDTYDIDDDGDFSEKLPDRSLSTRQVNPTNCIDIGTFEQSTLGTCLGDISNAAGTAPDGVVDGNDMRMINAFWGTPGGVADLYPSACGDGTVNVDDQLVVLAQWGPCPPPGSLMGGGGGEGGEGSGGGGGQAAMMQGNGGEGGEPSIIESPTVDSIIALLMEELAAYPITLMQSPL